jgi:hypothetical protein
MTSTYVNDLRLEEIGDGDQSGTWGATTNTNLELIAEALSFGTEAITTNADTHTTTIADGATDPGRSLYLKYTGTLDSTCTITIGPNTISKTWYIENGTSGSQSIIISQGSGANVTIPTGQTKIVYSDGAGSGAAMAEIGTLGVTNLNVSTAATVATLDTSGAVNLNLVTDSTSSTSGALIVDGGVGIAKKLFVGTDLDVDGTANLDAVDIDGAVQLDATLTVGADDQGYDVILYGDTASANVTWDTSADDLILSGAAGLIVPDGKLTLGSTAVTSTGAELNILDGVTSNATEINTLDALSRGSIIYGNASAATTVLTKGSADTVLTSDGTDISWAAAAGGPSYTRSTTPPGSPTAGDWWLNTNSNQQSPFIYDGTLGWIQGDGTALGFVGYLAANSFSLRVKNNGVVQSVRFEAPIPQIDNEVSIYTDNTASPVVTSNTVRAVIKVNDTSVTNAYQFVIFANLGAAANFGDTISNNVTSGGAISHATRGIFVGGNNPNTGAGPVNHMEYITIATEGNATDFGDLTVARTFLNNACVASTTRGIILGGNDGSATNVIDYVTIAAPSNATDFGDLTAVTAGTTSVHSTTRGVRISGVGAGNVMDYITMASAGNATDFGDLGSTSNPGYIHAIHNGTYGWMNQNNDASGLKQKITIATAANASEIVDGSGPFGNEPVPSTNLTTVFAKGWIAASG